VNMANVLYMYENRTLKPVKIILRSGVGGAGSKGK
jgi:hypothetical protein